MESLSLARIVSIVCKLLVDHIVEIFGHCVIQYDFSHISPGHCVVLERIKWLKAPTCVLLF